MYILGWDEDLFHNRPASSPGFYTGFDTFLMETESVHDVTNLVPPRPMRMVFDHFVNPPKGNQSAWLSSSKDMIVDWVFYTPRTNLDLWSIPSTVSNIRGYLFSRGERDGNMRRIWRINATGNPSVGAND